MDNMEVIRAQAEQFLSYNGGDELLNYGGGGDDLLNFNGNDSRALINEINTDRNYTMTLSHATGNAKTYLVLPGLDPDSANIVADGVTVTKDGTAAAATGYPGRIALLKAEIKNKPHNVVGLKISAESNTIQQGYIKLIEKSAFNEADKVQTIQFAHFKGDQFNDKEIYINRPFVLGDKTQMEIFLPQGLTTLSWFFGASIDLHEGLKKKNKKMNAARAVMGSPVASAK